MLNISFVMALVVTTTEESSNRPYSFIYSFKGNKFTTIADRIPYYVSVMQDGFHRTDIGEKGIRRLAGK